MNKLITVFVVGMTIVNAQEIDNNTDTTKYFELKEVMVSASRYKKDVADIGRSVTVIDKSQIDGFLYQNAGELLSQQTGIYIIGSGQTPGTNQSIFMRGAASHQTAILIDGVRFTDPSAISDVPDLSELSIVDVDRIEIVQGSHSTLFGTSAVGGVINLLTPTLKEPGIHFEADAGIGTMGDHSLIHSEKAFMNVSDISGLYVNGGIDYVHSTGIDATVDTVTDPSVFKNRDKDGFQKKDYNGKIGFQNAFVDAYFSYKYNSQVSDIDKSAFIDDNNYVLNHTRTFFTYGGSYQIADHWNIQYIGGYSAMDRNAKDDSSIVDTQGTFDHTYYTDDYSGTTSTNETQIEFKEKLFSGVAGIGKFDETMNVKSYFYSWSPLGIYELNTNLDTLDLQSTSINVFFHVDGNGAIIHESLNKLNIATGIRYTHHDAFGGNIAYEFNPSCRIVENGLVFASYSTGFYAPSLYQLFAPNTNPLSMITRGNKDLNPEVSSSLEVGYKMRLKNSEFSLALSHNIVNNYIEYVYLWDKNITIAQLGSNWERDDYRGDTYLNLGSMTTNAVEFQFKYSPYDDLMMFANACFVSGKLQYDPAKINSAQTQGNHVQMYSNGQFLSNETKSESLIRRPNTANISTVFKPFLNLSLRIDAKLVGERRDVYYDSQLGPYGALANLPMAGYVVVDFSQNYFLSKNISINGRIENILNKKYYEIRGFRTKGRSFYLNLSCAI